MGRHCRDQEESECLKPMGVHKNTLPNHTQQTRSANGISSDQESSAASWRTAKASSWAEEDPIIEWRGEPMHDVYAFEHSIEDTLPRTSYTQVVAIEKYSLLRLLRADNIPSPLRVLRPNDTSSHPLPNFQSSSIHVTHPSPLRPSHLSCFRSPPIHVVPSTSQPSASQNTAELMPT